MYNIRSKGMQSENSHTFFSNTRTQIYIYVKLWIVKFDKWDVAPKEWR